MKDFGRLVSLIYFYLVSLFSLILLVFGIYHLMTFALNSLFYEKYPLRWGNEVTRCEQPYLITSPGIVPPGKTISGPSPEMEASPSVSLEKMQKAKELCYVEVESERKKQMVEDLKNSLVFTGVGVVLFLLHFPIALRRSRNQS